MRHDQPHPMAGKTLVLKKPVSTNPPLPAGTEFRIEDWVDRVMGAPWGEMRGNPACLIYAMRGVANGLSLDDEVVYGKAGHLGHLIHVSELTEASDPEATK